jgi:hypothetical protein
MLSPTAPAGFRPSGHGSLLVPLTTERQREVWTRDERKTLDRMARLVQSRGLAWMLKCVRPGCGGVMTRQDVNGEDVLRCACSDRIMARNL